MGQVRAANRIGLALGIVLLAAACSNGPGASQAPGNSTGTGGGGNGDISTVDACALLTPADIQQVTGQAVQAGINQDSNIVRQCEWDAQDATSGMTVGLTVRQYTDEDWQTVLAFPNATFVPGMGEAAYRNSPITGDLTVKKDGYEIDMAVLYAANTQAQMDQYSDSLMNLVLTRI
jgi:Protein of unknown function (DUF3558)